TAGGVLARRGCATASDPPVDLARLEFPQPTHPVSGHALLRDPRVDRVLRDTEVSRDVVGREPGGRHEKNPQPASGIGRGTRRTLPKETQLHRVSPGLAGPWPAS